MLLAHFYYSLILLTLCTLPRRTFCQSSLPPDPNPEPVTIPLDRRVATTVPRLQPGHRFLLRVNALTPPRSLANRQGESGANSTLVVDLISPYGTPIFLSAARDSPPERCNATEVPITSSCVSDPALADTYALHARSPRAFLIISPITAVTRVVLSIQNAGTVQSPLMTIHVARLAIAMASESESDTTSGLSLCPGSAAGARCSKRGTCDTESSQCQCDKGSGGRACETLINTIPSAQAQPAWTGEVPAARDSALLPVPLGGTVLKVAPSGPPSHVSLSARLLNGSVQVDGQLMTLDGGQIPITMICKMRGENQGVSPTIEPAPDIPTLYDVKGRATLVPMPEAGGMVYEFVCVSDKKIARDNDWLVAFMVDDKFGVAENANVTMFSVRSMRCGGKDMPECPLGFETGKQALWKWILLGACMVIAMVLVMCVILWACGRTIDGIRQSQTGSIIDGRIYQVVDDEGDQVKRRRKLKGGDFEDSTLEMMEVSAELYAYDTSDTVDMTDEGDDESKRRRTDAEKANWEKVWTAERERRRLRLLEEDVTSRSRRDVGSSSDRSLGLHSAWPHGGDLDMPVEMEMNR